MLHVRLADNVADDAEPQRLVLALRLLRAARRLTVPCVVAAGAGTRCIAHRVRLGAGDHRGRHEFEDGTRGTHPRVNDDLLHRQPLVGVRHEDLAQECLGAD